MYSKECSIFRNVLEFWKTARSSSTRAQTCLQIHDIYFRRSRIPLPSIRVRSRTTISFGGMKIPLCGKRPSRSGLNSFVPGDIYFVTTFWKFTKQITAYLAPPLDLETEIKQHEGFQQHGRELLRHHTAYGTTLLRAKCQGPGQGGQGIRTHPLLEGGLQGQGWGEVLHGGGLPRNYAALAVWGGGAELGARFSTQRWRVSALTGMPSAYLDRR